jgi:hypothetical protein
MLAGAVGARETLSDYGLKPLLDYRGEERVSVLEGLCRAESRTFEFKLFEERATLRVGVRHDAVPVAGEHVEDDVRNGDPVSTVQDPLCQARKAREAVFAQGDEFSCLRRSRSEGERIRSDRKDAAAGGAARPEGDAEKLARQLGRGNGERPGWGALGVLV